MENGENKCHFRSICGHGFLWKMLISVKRKVASVIKIGDPPKKCKKIFTIFTKWGNFEFPCENQKVYV